jgi:squalene synthase HpnC
VPFSLCDELTRYGPGFAGRVDLPTARAYCQAITRANAENFTVASWLLPRELRPHFASVYAYCRWSDDLADEMGDQGPELLSWWRGELDRCFAGGSPHPIMVAMRETVNQFAIPKQPFADLLTAFERDQRQKSYATFDDLLGYCRCSADPVGRIVLHLFRSYDDERAVLSDFICTGLQLANFWQDVARDRQIGRRYLPDGDLDRFEYRPADWDAGRMTPAFAELMRFEVDRTQTFFDRGKPLIGMVPKRLSIDLDLFIRGGEAVLSAIRRQRFDVWAARPRISKVRKFGLLLRAGASGLFRRA